MLDLFEGLNKTIEEFSLHILVEKSTRPLLNDSWPPKFQKLVLELLKF